MTVQCWVPDPHCQRPVTRRPPSTTRARPTGAANPPATAPGEAFTLAAVIDDPDGFTNPMQQLQFNPHLDQREFERSARHGTALSLVILDLDERDFLILVIAKRQVLAGLGPRKALAHLHRPHHVADPEPEAVGAQEVGNLVG